MVRRRTRWEIRQAAALLRRRGGHAAWAPIVDAARLARTSTSLHVAEHPLPRGVRALLAPLGAQGRAALVVNARLPLPERNFSIAHELGHWVLHSDALGRPAPRGQRRRQEWEADRFALDLLLPAELLRSVQAERNARFSDLARRLGVRPRLLRRRLAELRNAAPRASL